MRLGDFLTLLLALAVAIGGVTTHAAEGERALAAVRVHDVVVRGTLAFVGQTTGLVVLDVSDPTKHLPVGDLRLGSTVYGVTLEGDEAYLALGTHGVAVVDISDPTNLTLRHTIDAVGKVRRVEILDEYAVLAEGREGVGVLDLTDPTRPLHATTAGTGGDVRDIALHGRRVATAEGHVGARIVDVSRPRDPRESSRLHDSEGARAVAWNGERLLVAAGRRGLLIYRVPTRGRPSLETIVELDGTITNVHVAQHTAYVAAGGKGIHVVDVTPGDAPRRVATIKLPRGYPATSAWFEQDRVFVAADLWGIAIVDPSAPTGRRILFPRARGMQVAIP